MRHVYFCLDKCGNTNCGGFFFLLWNLSLVEICSSEIIIAGHDHV